MIRTIQASALVREWLVITDRRGWHFIHVYTQHLHLANAMQSYVVVIKCTTWLYRIHSGHNRFKMLFSWSAVRQKLEFEKKNCEGLDRYNKWHQGNKTTLNMLKHASWYESQTSQLRSNSLRSNERKLFSPSVKDVRAKIFLRWDFLLFSPRVRS